MLSHLNHDAGEGETEDDKDEADEKPGQARMIKNRAPLLCFFQCVCTYFNKAPGKRPELVPNHPVQDKEGHIRNHAGEDEAMRDKSRCFNQS